MASFIYDVVKELGMGVAKFWLILRIVARGFCRERETEKETDRVFLTKTRWLLMCGDGG